MLGKFGWQDGYSAFSLGYTQIPAVKKHIANQKEHHKQSYSKTRCVDSVANTIWNSTSSMFGIRSLIRPFQGRGVIDDVIVGILPTLLPVSLSGTRAKKCSGCLILSRRSLSRTFLFYSLNQQWGTYSFEDISPNIHLII